MKILRRSTLLLLSITTLNAYAFKAYNSLPFKYCTEGEESITEVLEKKLLIPNTLLKKKRFWDNLHDQNKHITDFGKIIPGTPVYIYIPKRYQQEAKMSVFDLEQGKIHSTIYKAKKGENLNSILTKEFEIPNHALEKHAYKTKIKRWNPNIKNFNSLQANQKVYIEFPKRYQRKCHSFINREIAGQFFGEKED